MPQLLEDLQVEFVSLVDRAAVRDPQNKSEPRRFAFWKCAGHPIPIGELTMTPEEMQAKVEKAEADAKAAEERAEKAEDAAHEVEAKLEQVEAEKAEAKKKTSDDDEDGDEMCKSDLPAEVAAQLEKAEKAANERIQKAEERAAQAEEIAKAEQDLRLTSEFIAKAEGLDGLPIEPGQFGLVLKRASATLAKEDFDYLDSLFSSLNEQVKKGAYFKEVGRDVGGARVPSDAYAEVQQKAAEIRKSDPKLSQGEAEALVMKGDRELQQRYLASVR